MKNLKKITSLILSTVMIFAFASFAEASGNYSDEVLKTVYNATKLIGNNVQYSHDSKITYGQISGAAVNIFTDEYDSSYAGLNTDSVFEHKYSRAFYAVARDVLNKKIILQIDNPNMTVGDVKKEIDPGIGTKPIIENSRTLLPVRAVVEEMNGNVSWNGDTREVTLKKGGSTIILTIDSTTAYLNGNVQTLDSAPIIRDGRTLLPIRFIAESFGYNVEWEPNERLVTISRAEAVALKAEEADKNATVGDTIDILTYYLAKRNNNTVTFNKGEILQDADRNAEINHKQFAQILCELDDIAPILVNVELSRGGKKEFVPVKMQKDLSKYPENSSDYRVILEEIPVSMYTRAIKVSNSQKPADNYDFARDYKDVFTDVLSPWIDAAYEQAGLDMKITYYPSLNTENGNGNTMRVKIDVISAKDKTLIGDIFKTADGSNPQRYFETGKSYFCDLKNNTPKEIIAMNMDNIASLSGYLTISAHYANN